MKQQYRTCPHCGARVAITKQNQTGICPAYACIENRHFYESDRNQDEHKKRIELTEKYKGLYIQFGSGTLHFFYGLKDNNMLFIMDTDCALYVINELDLPQLIEHCEQTNYKNSI